MAAIGSGALRDGSYLLALTLAGLPEGSGDLVVTRAVPPAKVNSRSKESRPLMSFEARPRSLTATGPARAYPELVEGISQRVL